MAGVGSRFQVIGLGRFFKGSDEAEGESGRKGRKTSRSKHTVSRGKGEAGIREKKEKNLLRADLCLNDIVCQTFKRGVSDRKRRRRRTVQGRKKARTAKTRDQSKEKKQRSEEDMFSYLFCVTRGKCSRKFRSDLSKEAEKKKESPESVHCPGEN